MRLYLANIESWTFPNRGSEILCGKGFEVGGNWLDPPFQRQLEEFSPDVVVYAPMLYDPYQGVDGLVLQREAVLHTPTILWALYPDYITGWDREKNVHVDGFLDSLAVLMPYFQRHLAQSLFTKRLLEERTDGYEFEVCLLGIDLEGIDCCRCESRGRGSGLTVLWQHRWSTDKNLQGAVAVIESLAAKHRDVKFIVGRKDDWNELIGVPQSLKDYYADAATRLNRLGNVQFISRFETQVDYWRFLFEIDIAFSCSYHETFGIAMLEKAYAGAACVAPNTVAYPEIHSGAVLVPHSQVASAVDRLIQEPEFRAEVAQRCRQNASKYDVSATAQKLAEVIARAEPGVPRGLSLRPPARGRTTRPG